MDSSFQLHIFYIDSRCGMQGHHHRFLLDMDTDIESLFQLDSSIPLDSLLALVQSRSISLLGMEDNLQLSESVYMEHVCLLDISQFH